MIEFILICLFVLIIYYFTIDVIHLIKIAYRLFPITVYLVFVFLLFSLVYYLPQITNFIGYLRGDLFK